MKINTFGFLLCVLFAISSLNNAWTDDDDLFGFDDEFDPMSSLDDDIDALSEFEINKSNQCRIKNDHYPHNQRCRKDSCLALCRKQLEASKAKCRKSKNDKVKKCYCYNDCDKKTTPTNPDNHIVSPTSAPAVSPAPNASPVYPPSGSPSPTPSRSTSPVASPTPVMSPAYPPSSPAPEPAYDSETPCEDDSDDVPPPKKTSSVGEFSDEDFDFIFS